MPGSGVSGYNIYADGSLAGTTSSTSLVLDGLTPGRTYSIQVQCFDVAGNLSALSSPISVLIPSPVSAGDDFPGVSVSTPQGEIALNTSGATTEVGEPVWADHSLWLSWTCPSTGRYTFDTLQETTQDDFATQVLGTPDLKAYWRLNEGGAVAMDYTGNNKHGVYVHGHTVVDGALDNGVSGAADLDGVTQYIEVADSSDLSISTTGLTVVCLIRLDALDMVHPEDGGGIVIAKGEADADFEWSLTYTHGALPTFTAKAGGSTATFTDDIAVSDWVMVTMTFDAVGTSGGVHIWRRNAERDYAAYLVDPVRPGSPGPLRMGTRQTIGYFNGALSDVSVYKRVLTADEINNLYVDFAGIQNPVPYFGSCVVGTDTHQVDTVGVFTQDVPVGDTLLMFLGVEFQAANTIFDTPSFNTWSRIGTSLQNDSKTMRLICYRCDVATMIHAGDTITIHPAAPVGIKSFAVEHFGPLGGFSTSGQAYLQGTGNVPPTSPAVNPPDRDCRVIAATAVAGPPDDTFIEDSIWNTAADIGTSSFDAGVPPTRTRYLLQDAQHPGSPVSTLTIPVGTTIAAGKSVLIRIAHTNQASGSVTITDTAGGNTYTLVKSQVDPSNLLRHSIYQCVLTNAISAGGHITMSFVTPLADYAIISSEWAGLGVASQSANAAGSGTNTSIADLNPDSLAGIYLSSLATAGPVEDTLPDIGGWTKDVRVGVSGGAVTLQTAVPVKPLTHATGYDPNLGTSRPWTLLGVYFPPAVTSGGPNTPHNTNITLHTALLRFIPFGAPVPYQPFMDAVGSDPNREWLVMVLSFSNPAG